MFISANNKNFVRWLAVRQACPDMKTNAFYCKVSIKATVHGIKDVYLIKWGIRFTDTITMQI
jgi:hypothetical protein